MESRNKLNIAGIFALIVVIVCFGLFYYLDNKEQQREIADFQAKDKIEKEKKYARTEKVQEYLKNTQKAVTDDFSGFVILGDDYVASHDSLSLESQLGNVLDSKLFYDINLETYAAASLQKYNLDIPVENHAVAGESYNTMLTRIGIKPLLTAADIIIPPNFKNVNLTFKTEGNKSVSFVKQSQEKLGKTVISGIKGSIYFNQDKDGKYTYSFVREKEDKEGKDTNVKSGTKISVESTEFSKDLIPIVFYGKNDFISVDAYIKTQKAIVDRQSGSGGRYIVIANTDENSELDKAMQKQFGDNYLRIDSITSSELDNISLANQVYDQMNKLGYFNNIKDKINETTTLIKDYDSKN